MIPTCRLIDIIIPAWKSQEIIIKALCSIASQKLVKLLKVTIVNDADGIGYDDIVKDFSKYMDIQVLNLEKNSGPGVARQYGIDHTDCPYIMFVDSDDTLYGSFAVTFLYQAIEKQPETVGVFGQHYLEIYDPDLLFMCYPANYVWTFAKMYRRSVLEKYDVRFNETRANEDVGFNRYIRLVTSISPAERPLFIEHPVYLWHQNPNSITRIDKDFNFNDNITGFIDNVIYAIKKASQLRLNNKHYILEDIIRTMADIYIFVEHANYFNPKFYSTNFQKAVEFYRELFEMVELTQDSSFIYKIIVNQLSQQKGTLTEMIPSLTYYQFMDKIREEAAKLDSF